MVSSDDVESAISLCDEKMMEISITQLLKHICSHFTPSMQIDGTHDQVFSDVVMTSSSKNVKFANVTDEQHQTTQDSGESPAKLQRVR